MKGLIEEIIAVRSIPHFDCRRRPIDAGEENAVKVGVWLFNH